MFEIKNYMDEFATVAIVSNDQFQIYIRQVNENLPTIEWTAFECSAKCTAKFHTMLAMAIRIAEDMQEELV